jgi:hypothetical protein
MIVLKAWEIQHLPVRTLEPDAARSGDAQRELSQIA